MSISSRPADVGGFTLVELVIIILIIGVLTTVAMQKLSVTVSTAQTEQTKAELDQLAYAIAGNPNLYQSGARANFGYVGDVGAFPPNLDALVRNPGTYTTWHGPYIDSGSSGSDYKKDAWKTNYTYADTLIRSTGSGSNIDKLVSSTRAELLSDSVAGFVVDAGGTSPGNSYKDSIWVQLIYPDGAGGLKTDSLHPAPNGWFQFTGVPVGNHTLRVIHRPSTDTMSLPVTVYPRSRAKVEVVFSANLW